MLSASSRATLARCWALHPRTSSRVGIEASGSLKLTSWQSREDPARINGPDKRPWRTVPVPAPGRSRERGSDRSGAGIAPVSYTHLRAHETDSYLVCRLL